MAHDDNDKLVSPGAKENWTGYGIYEIKHLIHIPFINPIYHNFISSLKVGDLE